MNTETILNSLTSTFTPTSDISTPTPSIQEESSLLSDGLILFINILLYISYYGLTFTYYLLSLPLQLLSYTTYSASVTFDTYSLIGILGLFAFLIYLVFRYKILNKYARLPLTGTNTTASPFDLHPDESMDDKSNNQYPDEFMGAFLSSIKVFGYLDKQVFHELARHLQTRKLKAGEILFRADQEEKDFYVVVEGQVQIFVKSNHSNDENNGENDEKELKNNENENLNLGFSTEWEGHHLLNQVESGGTVSSLFSILSVFTENLELPISMGLNESMRSSSRTSLSNDYSTSTKETITTKEAMKDTKDSKESKDSGKKSNSKKSVHPNIVARAAVDTTLAVIPGMFYILIQIMKQHK